MPRKVRDSNLETRTARGRLKVAHKPYFRLIEPGLHIGYRKLASGPGTWLARRYNGAGKYVLENLRTVDSALIVADDYSEADGHAIMTFGQAQERAKARRPAAREPQGPYTVEKAVDAYIAFLESEGRSPAAIKDTRYRDRAFIRPKLGALEVAELTADKLRRWRDELARAAPRLRTRKGEAQKYKDSADKRARRATANRTWTTLRAALNHAFQTDKVDSDKAWRKVAPFKGVDAARVRYLTLAEAKRLINACDPEFRPLLQAALLSGARYGQLTQLTVADFNPDASTLRLRSRKGDGSEKIHHAVLTDEGARFFRSLCAGRTSPDLILVRSNGGAWDKNHQVRPIAEASIRARIRPPVSFHTCRHTWASHAVMNGMPLMVVAKNLGHADTRMVERHYGHLAPSFTAEAVRKGAPRFGIAARNVRPLE